MSLYEADSDISTPSPEQLREAGDNLPPFALTYLQLPGLDPRIPRLAAQISGSASNNYDKAVALEKYLKTHYGYTLQLPGSPVADPLANFLFERKQGHCEYFASSMAVMLRTLRIPARVVNGFVSDEFNDVTGQLRGPGQECARLGGSLLPWLRMGHVRSYAGQRDRVTARLGPGDALSGRGVLVLAGVGNQL